MKSKQEHKNSCVIIINHYYNKSFISYKLKTYLLKKVSIVFTMIVQLIYRVSLLLNVKFIRTLKLKTMKVTSLFNIFKNI